MGRVTCNFCGYRFDHPLDDRYGCPNCNGEGLMSYVYLHSQHAGSDGEDHWGDLFTVGFYKPDGKWQPESDHETAEAAAKRVAYLNGANVSFEE